MKDSEYPDYRIHTMKLSILIQKKAFFLFAALTLLLTPPLSSFAAEKSNTPAGIEYLKADTLYEYDLNGDGHNETIQYKVVENDEKRTASLKLYINKKLYLAKNNAGLSYNVYLLDLNQQDGHLDFYIHTVWENGGVSDAFFVQYNGSELFHYTAFEPAALTKDIDLYRYTIKETDGKGGFTLALDTPYTPSIGCYYIEVPFRLKDGKITKIPTNTYSLMKDSKAYRYKAVKSFSAYQTAGSKTVAYKVKKGNTVTFDKMYVTKTGKVYFRMINSNGKKGVIRSDIENLFRELPAWG
jgi:hypothetical protein